MNPDHLDKLIEDAWLLYKKEVEETGHIPNDPDEHIFKYELYCDQIASGQRSE